MARLDDILQFSLEDIQRGVPVNQVVDALPEDAQELVPLIRLAALSRTVPHPQPRPQMANEQRERMLAAARARQLEMARPATPFFHWPSLSLGRGLVVGFSALVILALVAMGIGVYVNGPADAHSVRLTGVVGMVEVAPSANSEDWTFIKGDSVVQQGVRIRTYADSGLTLVYNDGSSTLLGPDSDLTLTSLDTGWGNTLKVQLTQSSGITSHQVVPLRGMGSYYLVDTPGGRVSVQGTAFDISIGNQGATQFSVAHGRVQITSGQSQVLLSSGQQTSGFPGASLATPTYTFRLQGPLMILSASLWEVNGVTFEMTPMTYVLGTLTTGDWISASGSIQPDGMWVADNALPTTDRRSLSSFTGVIEATSPIPGAWQVGSQKILVNQGTVISQGLQVGHAVKVSFYVLANGQGWMASAIQSMEDIQTLLPPTDTPSIIPSLAANTPTSSLSPNTATSTTTTTSTATTTPSPMLTPETTFSVAPLGVQPPANETSTTTNPCLDLNQEQQPDALTLAAKYNVSYQTIMGYYCQGFGFGEIDLAYSLSQSSGTPVDQLFAEKKSGKGWGTIRDEVTAKSKPVKPTKPGNQGKNGNNGSNNPGNSGSSNPGNSGNNNNKGN